MKDFPYEDIVHCEEPPLLRPRMPRSKRAAQFKPFAALEGYEEALLKVQKKREEKRELSEDEKAKINAVLLELMKRRKEHPRMEAVYYDETAGCSRTVQGPFMKFDQPERVLVIGKEKIPEDALYQLSFL